jgi:hypothetical protein
VSDQKSDAMLRTIAMQIHFNVVTGFASANRYVACAVKLSRAPYTRDGMQPCNGPAFHCEKHLSAAMRNADRVYFFIASTVQLTNNARAGPMFARDTEAVSTVASVMKGGLRALS